MDNHNILPKFFYKIKIYGKNDEIKSVKYSMDHEDVKKYIDFLVEELIFPATIEVKYGRDDYQEYDFHIKFLDKFNHDSYIIYTDDPSPEIEKITIRRIYFDKKLDS